MKAVILYENPDWLPPLATALEAEGVPFEARFVHKGAFDLSKAPEPAVYVNRMSASSDTRGHGEGLVLAAHLLAWVESAGLPVVNGSHALALEVSKVRQYAALTQAGLRVPETKVVVGGLQDLLEAAASPDLAFPCVYKYDRGGKGTGVALMPTREALERFVRESGVPEASPAATHLLQRYVAPGRGPFITRAEFVDGRFLYALEADTSRGFELCPADGCSVDTPATASTAPSTAPCSFPPTGQENTAGSGGKPASHQALFRPCTSPPRDLIAALERFVRAERLLVAGIEFIEDAEGTRYVYDVNCNTNYSPTVEAANGLSGASEVARLVRRLLGEVPAR